MNRSFGRILLALAICLALTATVSADTIVANYVNQTQAGSVQYSLNSGVNWTGTTAGIFNFNRLADPNGGTFPLDPLASGASILAFCIQLEQYISTSYNPVTFEVVDLELGRVPVTPDPPHPGNLGVLRALQIDALFTLAFTNGEIDDPVTNTVAQAVQVAIWEIAYETIGTLDTTESGSAWFQGAGSNVLSTADAWLNTINGIDFQTYQRQHFLWAMNNTSYQDFVIQTPGSPDIVVPEPGTMAMVGLALLGLGFVRRRVAN
jgi:hypothetical protein